MKLVIGSRNTQKYVIFKSGIIYSMVYKWGKDGGPTK